MARGRIWRPKRLRRPDYSYVVNDDVIGGRYRIDSLIAEGGMAKVYRGTDQRLGRTVAIKVLSDRLATDGQFVARFEAEAKAAASLDHPNVVRVFDTGADAGRHYIVMQYVQGSTLADLVRNGALQPSVAVDVAARVCDALDAAHRLGIVHRDVKPANIMLEDSGTVKVMDFGIAKTAMGGLTQAGDVLGTAAYLSPEQARGSAVDLRSDIYSLGCVLYQMLTGRTPLPGNTLLEVANRLATERPAPPSEANPTVGDEFDEVVMRALEKNPDRRFESALQMRRALEAAGSAQARRPPAASKSSGDPKTLVSPDPRGPRSTRPRWAPVAGIGLLGLVALIVGRMLVSTVTGSGAQPSPPPALPEAAIQSPSPAPQARPEAPSPSGAAAVPGAVDALRSSVESEVASADMSPDAAEDILGEVSKALSEYEDGDYGDAVEHIGKAREELEEYVEDGEVTSGAAYSIRGHLDRLQRLVSL